MKAWAATLIVATLLFSNAAASAASPQELIDYTRKLLEAGDIPEIADDAELSLVHDGKAVPISAAEVRRENTQSKALVKSLEVKEFKVQAATCDSNICHIQYSFRATAHLKNDTDVSADVSCDEDYRPSGTRFILIRGRQVERTETAS